MFEYIHHIAYVVSDMDDAVRLFRDTFELELSDRRVIEGETSVEMAAFRCGPTLIEVLYPINHPALAQFLEEHGPGLHHVAFAMRDLPKRIEELREKGVVVHEPFVAGTQDVRRSDVAGADLAHIAETGCMRQQEPEGDRAQKIANDYSKQRVQVEERFHGRARVL